MYFLDFAFTMHLSVYKEIFYSAPELLILNINKYPYSLEFDWANISLVTEFPFSLSFVRTGKPTRPVEKVIGFFLNLFFYFREQKYEVSNL